MADDTFVDIDLDEIDDSNTLPDGPIELRVVSIEQKLKEGVGKYPYLDIRVSPTEAGKEKRKFIHILSFHPDALWNLKAWMKAMGIQAEVNPKTGKKGFDYAKAREKKIVMTAYSEEDESGEKRTRFKTPYHRAN